MSRRCAVLIGMMGAGKSEVGELLAEQLGYDFVDTDSLIVKKAGKSVAKIFREDGEQAFRDLEREVIRELRGAENLVIATGGGAPVDKQNRRVFISIGHMIYLKASPRELYLRVKNDRGRPLLQVENPVKQLEEILAERKDYYEEADIVIDTEELGVDEVVDVIIDELAKRTIETRMD